MTHSGAVIINRMLNFDGKFDGLGTLMLRVNRPQLSF